MKQDLEHSFLFPWPLLSLPHTKLTILFFLITLLFLFEKYKQYTYIYTRPHS